MADMEMDVALDALLELSAAAEAALAATGDDSAAEATMAANHWATATVSASRVVEALRDSVMDAMGHRHMSGAVRRRGQRRVESDRSIACVEIKVSGFLFRSSSHIDSRVFCESTRMH